MTVNLDTWLDLPRVPVADTLPPTYVPQVGAMWYDHVNGVMKIYINGWIEIGKSPGLTPGLAIGNRGIAFVDDKEPTSLELFDGDLWYDYASDKLHVRVSGLWVSIDLV